MCSLLPATVNAKQKWLQNADNGTRAFCPADLDQMVEHSYAKSFRGFFRFRVSVETFGWADRVIDCSEVPRKWVMTRGGTAFRGGGDLSNDEDMAICYHCE